MNDTGVRTVGICGLGLIGSSAARALLARDVAVIGVDPNPDTIDAAKRLGVIPADSLSDLSDADLILLAAPTSRNVALLRHLRSRGPVVATMDLGSVKGPIVDEWLSDGRGFPFIATHPMAGSENSGFAAGSADLFLGAAWPVVVHPRSEPSVLLRCLDVILRLGAFPVPVSAAAHDVAVAEVSHMPHLLAGVLGGILADAPRRELDLRLAAGSFRDVGRVCGSPPRRTAEFLAANGAEVARLSRLAAAELAAVAASLESGDVDAVGEWLTRAHEARAEFDARGHPGNPESGGNSTSVTAGPVQLRERLLELVDTGRCVVAVARIRPDLWRLDDWTPDGAKRGSA